MPVVWGVVLSSVPRIAEAGKIIQIVVDDSSGKAEPNQMFPAGEEFKVQVDLGAASGEKIYGHLWVWPKLDGTCAEGSFNPSSAQNYEFALFPVAVSAGADKLHEATVPPLQIGIEYCVAIIRTRTLRRAEAESFVKAYNLRLETALQLVTSSWPEVMTATGRKAAAAKLLEELFFGEGEIWKDRTRNAGFETSEEALRCALQRGLDEFLLGDPLRAYQEAAATEKNASRAAEAAKAKVSKLVGALHRQLPAILEGFKNGRGRERQVWTGEQWMIPRRAPREAPASFVVTCGGELRDVQRVLERQFICTSDEYAKMEKQIDWIETSLAEWGREEEKKSKASEHLIEVDADKKNKSAAMKKMFVDQYIAALEKLVVRPSRAHAAYAGEGATPNAVNFASVDVGFAVGLPVLGDGVPKVFALPYVGFNIYFTAVDRTVPLDQLVGATARQRVSLTVGLSLSSPTVEKAVPGAAPTSGSTQVTIGQAVKPLFGSTYPMLGLGLRFTHFIRGTAGAFFFWVEDLNPVVADTRLGASPFVAVSLDIDVVNFLASQLGK